MTEDATTTPTRAQADAIDAFADALYDLLHERAQSVGILDISLEVDGWHVDGELMYSNGPDMGFTLDARASACAYCELLPGEQERWIEPTRDGIDVFGSRDDDARRAASIELLTGLLDARRPLLRAGREEWTGDD